MAIFAVVAESGSFTGAAKRLGVAKSAVSRHIALLEEELGVELLRRTTRHLSLTEAGASLHRSCAEMLSQAEQAQARAWELQQEPSGELRVTAPTAFADMVAPPLAHFMNDYPALRVALILSDEMVDLYEGGFDLAIRGGRLKDSSLISRRLAPFDYWLCGSPDYLMRCGIPEQPSDLAHHEVARYTPGPARRTLIKDDRRYPVALDGRIVTNDGHAVRALARSGACLAVLPSWLAAGDLQSGGLQVVLPDYHMRAGAIYALYPRRSAQLRRIKLLVQVLVAHLRDLNEGDGAR
jgi:DNA-binding transcriptional LysR family regulator